MCFTAQYKFYLNTDTDQNTGNLNTGIHYNTGKKGYDGAFYLLNTGNGNNGIVLSNKFGYWDDF